MVDGALNWRLGGFRGGFKVGVYILEGAKVEICGSESQLRIYHKRSGDFYDFDNDILSGLINNHEYI